MSQSPLVAYQEFPRAIVNESTYYGLRSYDLVGPPRRLFADGVYSPPLLEQYVDAMRVQALPLPSQLLRKLPPGDNWLSQTNRSIARLHSLFLIAEDPQERLTGGGAAILAHQVSLVRYVLTNSDLRRVLIADEVGLGKTIEAGLIIKGLLEQQSGLRVLYLAPARLVSNVHREFRDKLDLPFRMFSADNRYQADIDSDTLIIASIHRAVHTANRESVLASHPWDVLIVDECHHLAARGPNGQDANEHFDLVRQLVQRQSPEGRLILMSGTPHQGQRARFENLLSLLLDSTERRDAVRGRVIFRTKENVRDWNDRPLFPKRNVRKPRLIELGTAYRDWYESIGDLYEDVGGSTAKRRAGGWAKGQALQWAASSIQAGMGFLVRLAIRRLNWDLRQSGFRDAIAALRPYKGGEIGEPVELLFERLNAEISRQRFDHDLDDMEELEEEMWRPDATTLRQLLQQGLTLLSSGAATGKWKSLLELLEEAGQEKVVMFAQPVETVTALVSFLESRTGIRPAIIIGGQDDREREAQIRAFRSSDGPRYLVSSRAGGEGINLQVARRLIHIDVPWNPMEMEQRVGRVHRFGSRQTILVDTLLVEGTREVDAYRVAREKLSIAFGDLARDPEQFEMLFSRVMSLIPPQPLEEVISQPAIGANAERLGELIEDGLRRWKEFHSEFSEQQQIIQNLAPGAATWERLEQFLVDRLGAEEVDGYTIPEFQESSEGLSVVETGVKAVRMGEEIFACADTRGMPVTDAHGTSIPVVGLNTSRVAVGLRQAAFPDQPTGVALLRSNENIGQLVTDAEKSTKAEVGVLIMMRHTIRAALGAATEQSVSLHGYFVRDKGRIEELSPAKRTAAIDAILTAQRRRSTDDASLASWADTMQHAESIAIPQLGRPTPDQHQQGIRHAVWPLLSAVFS
jgi:superfamily II DNA or RNA helicase